MGLWREQPIIAGLIAVGVCIAGYAIAVDLRVLLLPVIPVVAYLVTAKSIARLVFIIGGGMLVLQSEATGSKAVYAAGAVLFLLIALVRVPKAMRTRPELAAFRPIMLGGGAVLGLVLLSYFVASSSGVGSVDWFRAALPYALLGTLPVIGLDVAIDSSSRAVHRVFVIFTAVAPVAFMVSFLDRRGISSLPFGQFAITSVTLCAAFLGYSLARLATRGRRFAWFAAALYVPLAVLLSGTRSGLALLAGVAGIVGHPKKVRLPVVKVAAVTTALAGVLWLLVPLIGSRLTSTPDFYARRFASIPALLGADDVTAADQSLSMRATQTAVLRQAFSESPLVGDGPGNVYSGITALDTPIALLAYFGLAGVLVLGGYVATWFVSTGNLRKVTGHSVETSAFRVFVFTVLGYFPLGLITDDKGLALALCLFVALMASSDARTEAEAAPDPSARSGVRTSPAAPAR